MSAWVLWAVALAVAAAVGWVLGRWAGAQDHGVRARVAEARAEELTKQLVGQAAELAAVRHAASEERAERAAAEARVAQAAEGLEEQKKLLGSAQEKLEKTFEALASEALRENSRAFLDLGRERLDAIVAGAKGEIAEKTGILERMVRPLQDTLERYEQQLNQLESARASDYGSLQQQIQSLAKVTVNLEGALRRPEVRGRWGQMTLRRVVELAGMTEHCDFREQVSAACEEGRRIPDMVVYLPAGREIVVDSKVAADAYLEAVNAADEEKRKEATARHAQQVRKHLRELASKSYWEQFRKAPEFVVMFMDEPFLSAALGQDPTLIEEGMQNRVVLATPTTLVALLHAVAYGWRQEALAKNARQIADLALELHERFIPFVDHLNRTGEHLSKAVMSFNKTILSLERRVLVSVRRFRELGAVGDKELPALEPVEQTPMAAQGPEELEAVSPELDADGAPPGA